MIRISLIKRGIEASHQTMRWSVPVLFAVFAVQLLVSGLRFHEMKQQQEAYATAQQALATLNREAESLAVGYDLQQLARRVAARNNWLIDRKNSPLTRLAQLQKDCPNNVSFVSYSADLTGGKILLTAPDLNAVSSWLNSHFGNRGNINVMSRESNLLMLQFIWSG